MTRDSRLREEAKEARMLVEKSGFGDCIGLDFSPDNEPPLCTLLSSMEIMWAMPNVEIAKMLKTASAAGKLLEDYGWEVKY